MSDRFKAFWLGIFILLGIAAVSWLLLFLKPSVGDGEQIIRVRFTNIEKISIGTRVTYAGKAVGEVEEINEIFDARAQPADADNDIYFYELVLRVDSRVKIYDYDEIIFSTSGLLGEKSIAIVPKAAPKGAPPPKEISDNILYARSTDTLEETIHQLSGVADSFETAMDNMNEFLTDNKQGMSHAIQAVDSAASNFDTFVSKVNGTELVNRLGGAADRLSTTMARMETLFNDAIDQKIITKIGESVDHIHSVTQKINQGQGSLGRLLHSEAFYLQLSSVLCRFDRVLSDIDNYGLLFQFSSRWRQKKRREARACQNLCTPEGLSSYLSQQIETMTLNIDQMCQLLTQAPCACPESQIESLINEMKFLEQKLQCCNQCH